MAVLADSAFGPCGDRAVAIPGHRLDGADRRGESRSGEEDDEENCREHLDSFPSRLARLLVRTLMEHPAVV